MKQSNSPLDTTSTILANFIQAEDGRPIPLNAGVKITGVDDDVTSVYREAFYGYDILSLPSGIVYSIKPNDMLLSENPL